MKRIFLVVLAVTALSLPLSAQQKRVRIGGGGDDEMAKFPKPAAHEGMSDKEIASSLADYAATLSKQDLFSGVVYLSKDGKELLKQAYGVADKASGRANDAETKFNIGSINKIFTKVAIAQLAAAGELSLDDTIRKHLPDYPLAAADKVTIKQLLNHSSGIGDFFGPKYRQAPPSSIHELGDYLPLFAREPLQFEPGTSQRYSNGGYIVLGLIIEKISGEKYRDYLAHHIFAPAGMKGSGLFARDEKVANRASGYTKRGPEGPLPERRVNDATLPGRGSSAGGGYSTVSDMDRFFTALVSAKLLPQKWTNWMLSGSFNDGAPLGLGIAGGAPGLNAAAEVMNGWRIFVLSNYDPPSAEAVARAARLMINGGKEEAED